MTDDTWEIPPGNHWTTRMREIGIKGGKSKSDAKRKASAENGKKGGRPRKRDKNAINNPQ
jgi:general stress protein YciG